MNTVAGVPCWGPVFVCKLPETVRLAFIECLANLKTKRRKLEVRAKLIARCVIDDKLQRVFFDIDWEDISRKPEAELARVFAIACEINLIPMN
jgi:hypothetical protein